MENMSNDVFFALSILEGASRYTGCPLKELIDYVKDSDLEYLIKNAQVFHCDESSYTIKLLVDTCNIPNGNRVIEGYNIPSYWTQGRSFWRIIGKFVSYEEDSMETIISEIRKFMKSVVAEYMSDYRTWFYWAPSNYLVDCYKENKILVND